MTIRKITIDNGVNFIPKSGQIQSITKSKDSKPETIKNSSIRRKQDKNISQRKKKYLKTKRRFAVLK